MAATGYCFRRRSANLWRLSRWRGWATVQDRLVLVLHVGFLFAALGFLFTGAAALMPDLVSPAAAVHVWAIGAIGTMTLAMMTRATLGHSGRPLAASAATQGIYLAVAVAMVIRVAAEFVPESAPVLLYGAAVADRGLRGLPGLRTDGRIARRRAEARQTNVGAPACS